MTNTIFSGDILVASRIVDFLSSGLYESPAACLKELVNNAYDADATHVDVFVKPDANRIIISDNGHGMNQVDFEKNFSKISESFKRETSDKTARGRKKIGKIGIGFIAANEICEVMQIISTKLGSTEKINVEINFNVMRKPAHERRSATAEGEFAKADYAGKIEKAAKDEHFTHIFLKEVRGPARDILSGARPSSSIASLYGRSAESIEKILAESEMRSWDDYDLYSQTMLELALAIPVEYPDGWAHRHSDALEEFTSSAQNNFSVQMDGTQIYKPTVLPRSSKSLIFVGSYEGKNVSYKTYIYAQHGVLRPQELNGVLIRIRGAAVGGYDSGFLGFSSSIGTLFQRWISSEILADDRLEDAMNIDRKTLRVTHPAYVELVDSYHAILEDQISKIRKKLYEIPAAKKKVQRANQQREAVETALPTSQRSASALEVINHSEPIKLNKSYQPSQIIELVSRISEGILSATDRRKLLAELVKELLGK